MSLQFGFVQKFLVASIDLANVLFLSMHNQVFLQLGQIWEDFGASFELTWIGLFFSANILLLNWLILIDKSNPSSDVKVASEYSLAIHFDPEQFPVLTDFERLRLRFFFLYLFWVFDLGLGLLVIIGISLIFLSLNIFLLLQLIREILESNRKTNLSVILISLLNDHSLYRINNFKQLIISHF